MKVESDTLIEGMKEQAEKVIADAKEQAEEVIADAKEQAETVIADAKEQAATLETSSRRTAQGISMDAAQKQFETEQADIDGQKKFWWWATAITIFAFFGIIATFYFAPLEAVRTAATDAATTNAEGVSPWEFIYSALLRILAITAVGGFMTLSLKMLRAHLHMSRLNKHRQRVANCVESFVNAGETPEARTLVLANLVEAVIVFGNSGILSNDKDTIAAQKTGVQLLEKTLKSAGNVGGGT